MEQELGSGSFRRCRFSFNSDFVRFVARHCRSCPIRHHSVGVVSWRTNQQLDCMFASCRGRPRGLSSRKIASTTGFRLRLYVALPSVLALFSCTLIGQVICVPCGVRFRLGGMRHEPAVIVGKLCTSYVCLATCMKVRDHCIIMSCLHRVAESTQYFTLPWAYTEQTARRKRNSARSDLSHVMTFR